MIDADVKTIVIVPLCWRRDEILKRYVSVRQRVKGGDGSSDCVHTKIRNRPVRKWLAVSWIDWNSKQALRKVPLTFQRRRNICDASDAVTRTSSFVIGKEECAIALDRTTQRSAELVADVFWFWIS